MHTNLINCQNCQVEHQLLPLTITASHQLEAPFYVDHIDTCVEFCWKILINAHKFE